MQRHKTGLISDAPGPNPPLSFVKERAAVWAFYSCEAHFYPLFEGKVLIP